MDRAFDGVRDQESKHRFKKCSEFRIAHLAGGHCEFAMADAAEAADMAIDGDVVRRIGEDEFRLGALRAADRRQLYRAHPPHSRRWLPSSHRSPGWLTAGPVKVRALIFRSARLTARLARFLQDEVDLGQSQTRSIRCRRRVR